MKLKNALSMVLLAISSLLGFSGRRESCYNEASTCGIHPTGMVSFIAEQAFTTRYLAVQRGLNGNGVILNSAAARPWGVCMDEPAINTGCTVALFGITPGTLRVRSAAAIFIGAKVWTGPNGKFTTAYTAGAYYCGRAVSVALADGDIFELAHCTPILDAAGTTV